MKLTLETMPISTNRMYVGRKILTHTARANKQMIGWEARAAYDGRPLDQSLSVTVHFYYPNRRCNDIDNLKILFDALTGVVWEDDRLIDEQHVYRHFGEKNPRVEIDIKKL